MKLFGEIFDFLFPADCPICLEPVSRIGGVCAACFNKINWISDQICNKCGYPFPADMGRIERCPRCITDRKSKSVDKLRCACVYDEGSKQIVLPFKHSGKFRFDRTMANSIIGVMRDIKDVDIVVPVPLAWRRMVLRGYNQAALIGRIIARRQKLGYEGNLIAREWRPDQGHKSPRERRKNIVGVFRLRRQETIREKHILIVDDVVTTGATIDELAKVLLRGGAKKVSAVAFARAVKDI